MKTAWQRPQHQRAPPDLDTDATNDNKEYTHTTPKKLMKLDYVQTTRDLFNKFSRSLWIDGLIFYLIFYFFFCRCVQLFLCIVHRVLVQKIVADQNEVTLIKCQRRINFKINWWVIEIRGRMTSNNCQMWVNQLGAISPYEKTIVYKHKRHLHRNRK